MIRLGVICDYLEEDWPSMDLVADMLLDRLGAEHAGAIRATRIRPAMTPRFARAPGMAGKGFARNADRLINRFCDYPRHLRRRRGEFDLFHLCDHSYAQLLHAIPADRAGVYCHDLVTFRCVLEPDAERRPGWFRAMARRQLEGFRKAAIVFHTTNVMRERILRLQATTADRLALAPWGVSPEYLADPGVEPADRFDPWKGAPFVLHVGSGIPRKRIDALLDVFAAMRRELPELRLTQVGALWTRAQQAQVDRLGLGPFVAQTRHLSRAALADLYRRSAIVLLPSELEGFGMTVLESLACGAPTLASDLPELREVGGDTVGYCPVGDVAAWMTMACQWLRRPESTPAPEKRRERARRYTWSAHAQAVVGAYAKRFPDLFLGASH